MEVGATSTEDSEASWSAALQAGVRLVDVMKPTAALLVVALVSLCSPVATLAYDDIHCNGQWCNATRFEACDSNYRLKCNIQVPSIVTKRP